MRRITFRRLLTWTFLLLLAVALSPVDAAAQKVGTVATFSVLGDFVRNVLGDEVGLHTLVGPEGDPHNFEPSPRDGLALARAAVVFENGLGFEVWLNRLYQSSRSRAKRVVVTQGLTPQYFFEARLSRKEPDPHMWLDPIRVIQMVRNIRDALIDADPANAERFQVNAERYTKKLRALDGWIRKQVEVIPSARRILLTSHNSFGYFAARYGFQIPGSLLSSLTTEASDPSARSIGTLVRNLRQKGVSALFPEIGHNVKLIGRVADEIGAKLSPPLYTGALGPPGTPGETYLKMMRYDVMTIVLALRP